MTGITLIQNHRDPIVDDLLEIYDEAFERGIINGTAGSSGKSKRGK